MGRAARNRASVASAPFRTPVQSAVWLASVLSDLAESWSPHDCQHAILDSIFIDLMDVVFLECGRKFGKSEIEAYVLWRWALTKPGAYYYIGPLQTQVKEIIWEPGRLQSIGPSKYIKKVDEAELRLHFVNGSFIKVDGSDNYQKYRGINPHGIVCDEYKDFRPEFWSTMDPNRATHKAQCLVAGTPPEIFSPQWDQMAAECMNDSDKAYFNFPTWANPHIDREWLKKRKDTLYARGEGVVWEREYGARRIYGGPGAIFPMFDRALHVVDHEELVAKLEKDRHHLLWLVTADPGTSTVFAVLFSAVNLLTKEIFHLDEIYLTSHGDTACSVVIPKIKEMREELFPRWRDVLEDDGWLQTYDEGAAWFGLEAISSFGESFMPTHKAQHKKDSGIGLIKDQLLRKKVLMSTRCKKLAWEVEQYIKTSTGQLPKENDHLIDTWRYANAAAGLTLVEEVIPEDHRFDDWRGFTPEADAAIAREELGFRDGDVIKMPDMEY